MYSNTLSILALLLLLGSRTHAFSPTFGIASRRHGLPVLHARNNNRRNAPVKEVKPPMNEEIEARELRVVAQNSEGKDEALGILSREEALEKAMELGNLDLILINANADPPVCKIADYSKYRYMQEKKAKEVKKNSKASEIKEVKMSYKIDVHDYGVRKKNASKFLSQGNRVKCTVMFRGREVQHDALGFDLLEKLASDLDKLSLKEGKPKREGRNLSLILSPRAEVLKAVSDNRKAGDKAKKEKKVAKKQQKMAASAAAAAVAASASTAMEDDEDEDDEGADDSDDILETSLDDLFGSDDFTDDLFS